MSLMSQRADCQLGVPRAKCGCLAVLSVTSTIKAAQFGQAIANSAKITQKPLNNIAVTRSFMDAFRNELEFFQRLLCERWHIRVLTPVKPFSLAQSHRKQI